MVNKIFSNENGAFLFRQYPHRVRLIIQAVRHTLISFIPNPILGVRLLRHKGVGPPPFFHLTEETEKRSENHSVF